MKPNPPGFIPIFGQGLKAKDIQEGTEGGKEWLKFEKLHKYWPTFSQWSYDEFMSITEDNIDCMLAKVGGEMSQGAKGRLINRIACLQVREKVLTDMALQAVSRKLDVGAAIDYLQRVAKSPLPSTTNSYIASIFVLATISIQCFLSSLMNSKQKYNVRLNLKMNDVLHELTTRPALKRALKAVHEEIVFFTNNNNWFKISSDTEGIWPQEENSVFFTVWPKSIVEDFQMDFASAY